MIIKPAIRYNLFRVGDAIELPTGAVATNIDNTATTFPLQVGHYKVVNGTDVAEFAVLPSDYGNISFLGTEGGNPFNAPSLDKIASLSLGWVRLHGGGAGIFWNEVQPANGVWDWTKADAYVSANANYKLIWSAWYRPPWQTDNTQFVASFVEYVRQVTTRYSNKLTAIEIWNEIAWGVGSSFSAIPGTSNLEAANYYMAMLKGAYNIIKSINPNIAVMGPAWSGWQINDGMRDEMIKQGMANYLDWVSWHHDDRNQSPIDLESHILQAKSLFPNSKIFVNELYIWANSAIGLTSVNDQIDVPLKSWQDSVIAARAYVDVIHKYGASLIYHCIDGETWSQPNWGLYGYEFRGAGPHPKTTAMLLRAYELQKQTPAPLVDCDSYINQIAQLKTTIASLINDKSLLQEQLRNCNSNNSSLQIQINGLNSKTQSAKSYLTMALKQMNLNKTKQYINRAITTLT